MRWKHPTVTVNYYSLIISAPMHSTLAVNDDGGLWVHESRPEYVNGVWICRHKKVPLGSVDLEGRDASTTAQRVSDLPVFGGLDG
jgi:hypothetical protein